MKYTSLILLSALFLFAAHDLHAKKAGQNKLDVKLKMESILSGLSRNLDQFEQMQKRLETSGVNNASYDENKNIWLSTVLAVQAIASICENEQDLLHLFWDLKKARRDQFITIRIKSLETSIQQITTMMEQIRINHRLLPPDLAEIDLFNRLQKNANSTIELLRSSIVLISSKQSF